MNKKSPTALLKKHHAELKQKTKNTADAHDKLELLFTLVNRAKAEF